MSYTIPFHREKFVAKTLDGNEQSDSPVTFRLSMAAGSDHARLKSILYATINLIGSGKHDVWTPDMQASVVESFRTGPDLFINCVGEITNLAAPAVLCRHVGIPVPDRSGDDVLVPITDGKLFARVAPYLPSLALEVALEIQRLTINGAIDPRFTKPSSGSPEKPAIPSGSASDVPPTNDGNGTAASL